jgi:2-dehydropantoate 2-reductase
MRIAIFGAGAIGGYMGAKLAQAGVDVTLIARGPHLAAMQASGLKLIEGEGEAASETITHPRLVADSRDAGPQDYVVLAVKAHSLPPALDAIAPLLGPETAVVPAQNGVPWWYFYKLDGPWGERRLESVDPGGRIWDVIGPQRVIGCVVYPACEIEAPGVVRHTDDNRFSLGEPDGSRTDRMAALAQTLNGAGLRAPLRTRLRSEIWVKIWGNVALNPLTTLTRSTLAQVCANPETRTFARAVMLEAEAVATALGEKLPVSVDQRLDGAAEVGEHKTSMLQDLELGRPMEIDALTGAVVELAGVVGVDTPNLRALDGMVRLLAQNAVS